MATAVRSMSEKSRWLTHVSVVLWKQAGALKHNAMTLHRGCPLLLLLLDGLHHYLNIAFLCVLTGGTVNMSVSCSQVPRATKRKIILFWLGVVEAHL